MSPIANIAFSDSSVGKESAYNAGDPRLPGSGRSPGEGIGYPLQYSWASLVVQLVKNLPAMQETWVWSLLWENPLEKEKATHSNTLAWRIPWTMGSQRVWHDWTTFPFIYYNEWYPFWKQFIVLHSCVNYECSSQIFDECYTVPGILDKGRPFPHITVYSPAGSTDIR